MSRKNQTQKKTLEQNQFTDFKLNSKKYVVLQTLFSRYAL